MIWRKKVCEWKWSNEGQPKDRWWKLKQASSVFSFVRFFSDRWVDSISFVFCPKKGEKKIGNSFGVTFLSLVAVRFEWRVLKMSVWRIFEFLFFSLSFCDLGSFLRLITNTQSHSFDQLNRPNRPLSSFLPFFFGLVWIFGVSRDTQSDKEREIEMGR